MQFDTSPETLAAQLGDLMVENNVIAETDRTNAVMVIYRHLLYASAPAPEATAIPESASVDVEPVADIEAGVPVVRNDDGLTSIQQAENALSTLATVGYSVSDVIVPNTLVSVSPAPTSAINGNAHPSLSASPEIDDTGDPMRELNLLLLAAKKRDWGIFRFISPGWWRLRRKTKN